MAEMRKRARSKKAGEPASATPTPEAAPSPAAAAEEPTPTAPAPSLAVPESPAAPEPSIPPDVAPLLVEEAPPVEPPPAPPVPKEKPKKQAVAAPAPMPAPAPPPTAAPVPVPASPVPPATGGPTPPAAAEARKESAPAAAVQTIEHVLFALGDEEYAIPIEKIVEIVPYRNTTPVPNADETVLGILSLRGVVVTILDVRSRLGGRRVPPGPDTRFIVLGLDKEMVGLFVDRVRRVVRFAATDIEPPPRISSSEGSDCVAGVVERGGRIVIVLDLERLLAPEIVEEIR